MRLVDLDPRWASDRSRHDAFDVLVYAANHHGMGLTFRCPCCPDSGSRLAVFFTNPFDGGQPHQDARTWARTGDTFETLSISPSIDASASGHWHGFITNGEIR